MNTKRQERIDYITNRMLSNIETMSYEEENEALEIPEELKEQNESQAIGLFGGQGGMLQMVHEIVDDSHVNFTNNTTEDALMPMAGVIVDFVEQASEAVEQNNPYKKEQEALDECSKLSDEEFLNKLGQLLNALAKHYLPDQLNVGFYVGEFNGTMPDTPEFGLARDALMQDWGQLLSDKENAYEKEALEEVKQKFQEQFKDKIFNFHKLNNGPNPNPLLLSLCWGDHPGEWKEYAFDIFPKYEELVRNNQSIQQLLGELGRDGFKKDPKSIRVKKKVGEKVFFHAQKSDIYGICEGGDLSSLLPSELGILSVPELENDFYKRYSEKKLQVFSYQSKIMKYEYCKENKEHLKPLKQGPFIVCIDTSGSMQGTPEEVAKTICYGLIVKSQEQNRNCFVVSFSTKIEVLDISDLKNNLKPIVQFLMNSFRGGTDLEPAMKKSLEMLTDENYVDADVLFISDFQAFDFSTTTIEKMDAMRDRGTRFHGLLIGKYYLPDIYSRFDMQWEYVARTKTLKLKSNTVT